VSVQIPKAAVAFGSVTPPQGDVIDLRIHLGGTKEVSSFECLLKNWDKKYSPGGSSPITVGMNGHIDIGRGSNVPQIITCRVESVKYESTPTENYVRVSGRCWGEKLFRRVVTKTYENKKGEEVVRDIIDGYVGLSHVRENSALTSDAASGQKDVAVADASKFSVGDIVWIKDDNASEYNEVASITGNTLTMVNNLANTYTVAANGKVWIDLIEKTDTTYTKLEYENTPAFDILKYIAESADKAGVIGYDFRVAPDGKFEFFPRNSKTSPVSLSEKIEVSSYRKDIHRIRNKIYVYGTSEKPFPLDQDGQPYSDTLTEDLSVSSGTGWNNSDELVHDEYGKWTVKTGSTNLALDSSHKHTGEKSVKVVESAYCYYTSVGFQFNSGKEINADEYPQVIFAIYIDGNHEKTGYLRAEDINGKCADKRLSFTKQDEWEKIIIPWGSYNADRWDYIESGFDWTKIKTVIISVDQKYLSYGNWWVDMFHFGYGRWKSTQEDTASQNNYGLRELVEVDEELTSDNACERRAKALLDHLKDPAEYLRVRSTVIDYGNNPLLPMDKINVKLPNENVDSDFRIESVEYRVDARTQTLEIALELGKAPPLLADYLYGMRSTTVTVEKLARTKLGRFKIPTMAGAGVGSHARGHEAGDENGDQWPNLNTGGWDRITGWISPKHIGPYSDTADVIKFRTKNKAGSAVLDHLLIPSDNEHGVFGRETEHWKELHSKFMVLYHGLASPYGDLRIKVQDEDNPKARLTEELLEFGPGGTIAPDVYLKRVADNSFELKAQYLRPQADNILEVGASDKKVKVAYVSSLLLPTDGYLHIITYGEDNPKARLTQDSLAFGPGGLTAPDTWLKRLAANQFESSGDIVPDSDNARSLGVGGASPKRWKEIHAVDIHVSNMLFNFHLVPDADNTYDLGDNTTPKRWRDLFLSGKLMVGGYVVITADRVLQNVTADAGIITSGQFPLARLPRGTDGYVLEAQGADYDPMYVNPNGRYTPAGHNHAAADITSGVLAEDRIPTVFANARTFNGGITMGAALNMNSQAIQNLASLNQAMPPSSDSGSVGTTTTYWNCIAGNSVWYKALGQFDALDDLALIKRIRGNGKTDKRGMPLADPESLPPEVTENGLINAGALMGLLIGAVKQLAAKVEALEKELKKAKRGVAA